MKETGKGPEKTGNNVELDKTSEGITAGKKIEETLIESEERLKDIVDVSFDGIVIHDQGKIIFGSEKACRFLGYERMDELIGLKIIDLVVPGDRERVKRNLELAEINPNIAFEPRETALLRKDGRVLDVENYSRGTVFQGRTARIIAFRDITERKKAEKALKESEERYRFIAENATDILWSADLEGNLLFLSPAHETISGYSLEESLKKKIWDFLTPDSVQKARALMTERLNTDGESQADKYVPIMVELEYRHKDGSTRLCEVTVKFFRDAKDNSEGIIGIARDVTQRKRMELQLRQVNKMQAVGTLAGGVAHDFNNLLMGIQGRASIMLMDQDPSHAHYEHLNEIGEYVRSASALTKQLLGFAKRGKYEVKTTNPNDILRKTVEMFGRTNKDISIKARYTDNIYSVFIDRGQIEQVFLNLLVNSRQSMPDGGDLLIETGNVRLTPDYAVPHQLKPGDYIRINFTDTGMGMDKDIQERIFEPFFTTREMGRGTGLGLASAYGIIKNHDGLISVYSEKGKGATFSIYLPASFRESEKEEEREPGIVQGLETVLLVDDEQLIIEVTRKMLGQLGYKVLVAESGEKALEIYKKNRDKIDLIILDMIMPRLNGGDTFDRLRMINNSVKVLLSSGYSINGQAKEILARGCNGFLQKPFDMVRLSQKIREVLE